MTAKRVVPGKDFKEEESKPALRTGPIRLLEGYKDRLPADASTWDDVLIRAERVARDFGFVKVDTPAVEDVRLYRSGKDGGVGGDVLVALTDAQGYQAALRPFHALSLARAYQEHGYAMLPQPVKLFALGPVFRNEARTGNGTYRQFTECCLETFGDLQPVVDAQMIAAVFFLLQELSVQFRLRLNSIGHAECRANYTKLLVEYYKVRKTELCGMCKDNLSHNPLALLSCNVPECQALFREAPQIVDHLCEEDRAHFVRVLEHLDEVDVSYELDPRLLLSPTLFNRTVISFVTVHEGRPPLQIANGGRHDQLTRLVGEVETPAFGVSISVERILAALREQNRPPVLSPAPDVFLAQLGDAARRTSLKLFLELRREGLHVAEALSKEGIKGQLEMATKLRTKYALILGQKEILDGTILIRDMENGIQEVVDFQKIIGEVKKRLTKTVPNGGALQPPASQQAPVPPATPPPQP